MRKTVRERELLPCCCCSWWRRRCRCRCHSHRHVDFDLGPCVLVCVGVVIFWQLSLLLAFLFVWWISRPEAKARKEIQKNNIGKKECALKCWKLFACFHFCSLHFANYYLLFSPLFFSRCACVCVFLKIVIKSRQRLFVCFCCNSVRRWCQSMFKNCVCILCVGF